MVRGSLWTAVVTILALPMTFVASVVVARSLSPEGLGRFATYVAVFAIVGAISNLGWSEATMQWLASATARGERPQSIALIRRCAGYHVVVAGPITALAAFLLLLPSGATVAVAAFVIVWVMFVLGTSTVILTATARNATAAQIALVATTATQLAVLSAALATESPSTTWVVQLGALCLGPAMAVVALAGWQRRALLRPKLSFRQPQGFFAYATSACAAGLVASIVFGRSEIFVLQANDLLAAAGVFTVVTGLASQITAPIDSLLAPLAPIAAGVVAVDGELARRSFARALRVSAFLGAAAACVIVPVGVMIIVPLYGDAFAAAPAPFLVLALVSCMQSVLGPVTAFAFATRSAPQILRVNLICLGADIALTVGLVPILGLWGAVIGNASAQITSLLLMSLVVSRRLDVPMKGLLRDAGVFGVGLVLGAAGGAACLAGEGADLFWAPVLALVGATAFVLVLRCIPHFKLREEDMAVIARGSSAAVVGRGIRLLRRAGIVRGPA